MNRPLFDDAVQDCLQRDRRFAPEAYYFIRDALDYAQKVEVGRRRPGEMVHLTAAQLCASLREYALEQFGPLARLVFSTWAVHTTSDVGEVVYLLIDAGAFARSEGDAREDFDGLFDFACAFDEPFEPRAKPAPRTAEVSALPGRNAAR